MGGSCPASHAMTELLESLVEAVVAPPDAIPIELIPVAAEAEGADAEEIEDAAECAADYALLNQSFRQRSAVVALRECLEMDEISMAAARADWLPQVINAALLCCELHSTKPTNGDDRRGRRIADHH